MDGIASRASTAYLLNFLRSAVAHGHPEVVRINHLPKRTMVLSALRSWRRIINTRIKQLVLGPLWIRTSSSKTIHGINTHWHLSITELSPLRSSGSTKKPIAIWMTLLTIAILIVLILHTRRPRVIPIATCVRIGRHSVGGGGGVVKIRGRVLALVDALTLVERRVR